MITRNQLIREWRNHGGSWQALVMIYGLLMMVLFATASTIT